MKWLHFFSRMNTENAKSITCDKKVDSVRTGQQMCKEPNDDERLLDTKRRMAFGNLANWTPSTNLFREYLRSPNGDAPLGCTYSMYYLGVKSEELKERYKIKTRLPYDAYYGN